MSWLDYVQSRLQELQPASVYALEASAFQLLTRTLPKTEYWLDINAVIEFKREVYTMALNELVGYLPAVKHGTPHSQHAAQAAR